MCLARKEEWPASGAVAFKGNLLKGRGIMGPEDGQKGVAYLSGQEVLEVDRKYQPL